MAKDDRFYRPEGHHVADTIITANRENHSMLRRQLANGFSERSMRAQEPIFREYVDLLIQRLTEHSDNGQKTVDMRSWFNFTTFDVIGNLGFGSDFGCLEKSCYHPWVKAITSNLKDITTMQIILQFLPPSIIFLLKKIGLFQGKKDHETRTREKLYSRMEVEAERPDFIEGLLKKRDVLVSTR